MPLEYLKQINFPFDALFMRDMFGGNCMPSNIFPPVLLPPLPPPPVLAPFAPFPPLVEPRFPALTCAHASAAAACSCALSFARSVLALFLSALSSGACSRPRLPRPCKLNFSMKRVCLNSGSLRADSMAALISS